MKAVIEAAAVTTEKCYYRDEETGKHFVNATFASASFANFTNEQAAYISNDLSKRYQVSDVCVLPTTQVGTGVCTWDTEDSRFVTGSNKTWTNSYPIELKL